MVRKDTDFKVITASEPFLVTEVLMKKEFCVLKWFFPHVASIVSGLAFHLLLHNPLFKARAPEHECWFHSSQIS